MPLQKPFPFSATYKIHILIAIILGLLLSFILIVLEPVGIGKMQGFFKNAIKIGYGITIALGYLLSHFLAKKYSDEGEQWSWGDELIFQLLSGILGITLAYLYHDCIINGNGLSITMYLGFLLYLALPIFPLLVAPTILLRYFLIKPQETMPRTKTKETIPEETIEYLKLCGQNQKDELIVAKDRILYIKSVENYVQVFYLDEGVVENRIFRGTLANIMEQADFLVRSHRSYLINPLQSYELNGNSQKSEIFLEILGKAIPVSRSYYGKVKKVLSSIPKG